MLVSVRRVQVSDAARALANSVLLPAGGTMRQIDAGHLRDEERVQRSDADSGGKLAHGASVDRRVPAFA
jgi:hypothetical protein